MQESHSVVVLSSFTGDLVASSLQAILDPLLSCHIQMAPYNQIFQELLNPSSITLSNHDGYANIILFRLTDLGKKKSDNQTKCSLPCDSDNMRENLNELIQAILLGADSCKIPWIICLCPESPYYILDSKQIVYLRQLEGHLKAKLETVNNIYFINPENVTCLYPSQDFFNPTTDQLGNIPYTFEYFCLLGAKLARTIYSILMKPYKVIILDCDETLWTGLCGEDGLDGVYLNQYQKKFQEFMLEQINAGMLLCICSKNNEEDVKKIFDHHPDMILQLENFVGFKANWKAKSENIEELSKQLNLNLDSFIFIDDNPMECAEISSRFPQVFTIQAPKDSRELLTLIQHLWIFDHSKITQEDRQRTLFYKQEINRSQLREKTESFTDFINKLELHVSMKSAGEDNFLRILQLIKRCNQFNFTGENQEIDSIEKLIQKTKKDFTHCYVISVNDRFGDYGEVGVILTQVIENILSVQLFLLSCRVLGKSVEHRVVKKIAEIANNLNFSMIQFNFSQSSKNEPAQQFFSTLSQLPNSKTHELDKKNKFCLVRVVDALDLYFEPIHSNLLSKNSKKNKKVESSQRVNLKKILIDIAEKTSSLNCLIEMVKSYQKNQNQCTLKNNAAYIPPGDDYEKYLQKIFEKILNFSPVSIQSNFFTLGGSSLTGTLLLAEISQYYNIHATIDWLFDAPSIEKLAQKISDVVINRTADLAPIQKIVNQEDKLIPLSFAQQRIWFLSQLHPDTALYNTFIALQLCGQVKEAAVIESFQALVERHASLRTTFTLTAGTPYQVIHLAQKLPASIEIIDGTHFSIDEIRKKAYTVAQRPFNLQKESLVRVTLLKQNDNNYYLFFCTHHIILDGHSFNILMREFALFYSAFSQNQTLSLEPIKIQYADFSVWQKNWLKDDILQQQKNYWINKLADFSPLNFPTDFPRSEEMSTQGKRISFHIDQLSLGKLREISRRMNVTLFTTIISCYAIVLYKYTEKKDIVIGTGIAGRQYPGVENIIGHFVNILVLRFNLTENFNFLDFVIHNHKIILEAYAHQDIPFEELVKALSPHRNISEHPLVQMMMVFQEGNPETIQLPGVQLKRVFSDNDNLLLLADYDNAKLDITLDMQITEKGLEGLIEYNCHLFEAETINRFIEHFSNVLKSIGNNPEQNCIEISVFSAEEYKKIIFDWNKTNIVYSKKNTVIQLFEQFAQEQPEYIAVSFCDQDYTYRWLNEKANQVAHYLQSKNLRGQMLIGLFFTRGIDLIINILAVFKLGAVYFPISANLPDEQIRYLLDDSGAQYIVTHPDLEKRILTLLEHENKLKILSISYILFEKCTLQAYKNLTVSIMPDNTACLIYTSGSTGNPKGVLIKHQGLLNTICAQIEYLKINRDTCVLQWASINFDAALWEIFGALSAGAKLCLISEDDILNPLRFIQILQEQAVSLLTVTPSYLNALPTATLPKLQTLVVAGEVCPVALFKRWSTGRRFVNAYGLTEASICSTMETVDTDAALVTLGKPIANTQVYVLNQDNMQPMPIGMPGELYIAGEGVAKGYHQRDDLNKERFLFNPFNPLSPESKMYRTGDRVRWLSNGCLQYIGRQDDLIKIRGIRTNLNAIVNVLQEHPLVAQAEITLKQYSMDDQKLIAYLVLRETDCNNRCILNNQHLDYWQTLYEDLYVKNSQLTTVGWESSYTHHSIPSQQMQEWVDNTANRILAFSPKKILEIGCGNGLLVSRIVSFCQEYLATDFSQQALDALNAYLSTDSAFQKVTTQKRLAHEFSEKDNNHYDTVVLNSVVQYFPNINYLITVLDGCVAAIESCGQIYIGDVRNLNLQEAFHGDVEYYKLTQNKHFTQTTYERWFDQIANRISQDPELVISPHFFRWYAQRHSQVTTYVTIELRRGIDHNEMNCFRYDVVLHINKQKQKEFTPKYNMYDYDWRQDNFNIEKLENIIKHLNSDGLKIKNIPNLRVQRANLLIGARNSCPKKTSPIDLSWIENYLQTHSTPAVDPEILWQLGERNHYQVHVTYSQESPKTHVDVFYIKKSEIKDRHNWLNWIELETVDSTICQAHDLFDYSNTPTSVTLVKYISEQIKLFLGRRLPSHMIPVVFIILNKMPLTANGKIDKTKLPEPRSLTKFDSQPRYEKSSDPVSRLLRQIFAKTLNLTEEQINDQDSFFYLGGHSLLAMKLINEIQKSFHIAFSIRDLFKFSSVNEMTAFIKKTKYQIDVRAMEPVF